MLAPNAGERRALVPKPQVRRTLAWEDQAPSRFSVLSLVLRGTAQSLGRHHMTCLTRDLVLRRGGVEVRFVGGSHVIFWGGGGGFPGLDSFTSFEVLHSSNKCVGHVHVCDPGWTLRGKGAKRLNSVGARRIPPHFGVQTKHLRQKECGSDRNKIRVCLHSNLSFVTWVR